MDLTGSNFGYDEYNPVNYYNVQPEDLNPSLRLNYTKQVNDYYSEPAATRFRMRRNRVKPPCTCGNHPGDKNAPILDKNTIYILIVILIVIIVIQFFVILCSGSSVVTNIITHKAPDIAPPPAPAETTPEI